MTLPSRSSEMTWQPHSSFPTLSCLLPLPLGLFAHGRLQRAKPLRCPRCVRSLVSFVHCSSEGISTCLNALITVRSSTSSAGGRSIWLAQAGRYHSSNQLGRMGYFRSVSVGEAGLVEGDHLFAPQQKKHLGHVVMRRVPGFCFFDLIVALSLESRRLNMGR